MQPTDQFTINPYLRFLLVIRTLGPIFFMGITLWAISTPYLELSTYGPLILLGLAAWAIYEGIKLFKWFNFSIQISDQALVVGPARYPWTDIETATAKTAFQFQTFIELTTKSGKVIIIPGAIQDSSFVLGAIEKRVPQLQRVG